MHGQGDTVPYIICVKKAEDGSIEATKGLAERAYHPEEITDKPQLTVDNEYYLGQQVRISGWMGPRGASMAQRLNMISLAESTCQLSWQLLKLVSCMHHVCLASRDAP